MSAFKLSLNSDWAVCKKLSSAITSKTNWSPSHSHINIASTELGSVLYSDQVQYIFFSDCKSTCTLFCNTTEHQTIVTKRKRIIFCMCACRNSIEPWSDFTKHWQRFPHCQLSVSVFCYWFHGRLITSGNLSNILKSGLFRICGRDNWDPP